MPPKPRGDFVCSVCGFRCRYDYFGKTPPFEHEAVRWVEDIFALQNPSPAEYGSVQSICLGALCSVCASPVCVDDKCSLFYKLRFCKTCSQQADGHFPADVAERLSKDLRKLSQTDCGKGSLACACHKCAASSTLRQSRNGMCLCKPWVKPGQDVLRAARRQNSRYGQHFMLMILKPSPANLSSLAQFL
ncbi:CDPF1 [Symbiodinium sp. KB8]|nr:CDPF1 [Symbiodinium sp. KB8]